MTDEELITELRLFNHHRAANRLKGLLGEERQISPGDVAHVTVTAIEAVADVKDAEIKKLRAEIESYEADEIRYLEDTRTGRRIRVTVSAAATLASENATLREENEKLQLLGVERDALRAHRAETYAVIGKLRAVVDAAKTYYESAGGCDNPDVELTCRQTKNCPRETWCYGCTFGVALEELEKEE